MSAPSKAPNTIEGLQESLRLTKKADVEALLKTNDIKEAFRQYRNRCLSSGSTKKLLPDWKAVDEYLQDKLTSRPVRRGQPLEESVAQACHSHPYELIPHVSLFVLTVTDFLTSSTGKQFDVGLAKHSPQDAEFDRTYEGLHRCLKLTRRKLQ
ncbi:hypothetical protein F4779DRAFT_616512 [Xylariaceae sp. FL0662B]|nr:hypothetical protein F4779DRAFT_616512 [Xylariaceae sp. FL0662B]